MAEKYNYKQNRKKGKLGMKLRRLSIYVMPIMAVLSLAILPGIANATVDVSSAQIVKTGYYPGAAGSGFVIQLVDKSASPAWSGPRQFYLSTDLGNEGYAIILTAYSMGKTVWVRIGGNAEPGSLISIIYIND